MEELQVFKNYGIVDVGSNGIRLKIISNLTRSLKLIYFKRLPISLISPDDLIPLAMLQELIVHLVSFKNLLISYDLPYEFSIVATESLRRAKNRQELQQLVSEKVGVEVRVLSEVEEAYFTSLGIASSLDLNCGYVWDLGGGSLEFNFIDKNKLVETDFQVEKFEPGYSFQLGSKILKGWALQQSSIEMDVESFQRGISDELDLKLSKGVWENTKVKHFFWTGGGLRALGYLAMYETNYPLKLIEGFTISASALLPILNKTIQMNQAQIEELDILGISQSRLSELKINCIVAKSLLSKFQHVEEVVFSSGGITNGILFEKLTLEQKLQDPILLDIKNYIKGQPKLSDDNFDYLARVFNELQPTFFQDIPEEVVQYILLLSQLFTEKFPSQSRSNFAFQLFFTHGPFSNTLHLSHRLRLMLSFGLASRYNIKELDFQYFDTKMYLDKSIFKQVKLLGTFLYLVLMCDPKPVPTINLSRLDIRLCHGNKLEMRWLEDLGSLKQDKMIFKCIKKLNKLGMNVILK